MFDRVQGADVEAGKSVVLDKADLEIRARMDDDSVVIDVLKSGVRIHKLTIEGAIGRMEHAWIADMFAREDRVDLARIGHEADDYIRELNINQG